MKTVYPDEEIFTTMANRWNKTFYKVDKQLGRGTIRAITKAQTRYHMTRHRKKNRLEALSRRIDFIENSLDQLERKGIWEADHEENSDGEEERTGELEVNKRNQDIHFRWLKRYEELVKLELQIKNQENEEGKARSNQRRTNKIDSK
jgi:hypothetical protein